MPKVTKVPVDTIRESDKLSSRDYYFIHRVYGGNGEFIDATGVRFQAEELASEIEGIVKSELTVGTKGERK